MRKNRITNTFIKSPLSFSDGEKQKSQPPSLNILGGSSSDRLWVVVAAIYFSSSLLLQGQMQGHTRYFLLMENTNVIQLPF